MKDLRRRPVGRAGVRRRRHRQPLLTGPQCGVHEARVSRRVPRLRVGVGHDRGGGETRGANEELSGDTQGSLSGSGYLRNRGSLSFQNIALHITRQIYLIGLHMQKKNRSDSLTEFFLVCCISGWSANCTALLPPPPLEFNIPEAPVRLMVQKFEAEAAAAAAAAAWGSNNHT